MSHVDTWCYIITGPSSF